MAQKFNPLSGTFDIVLDKASEIRFTPAGDIAATNVQDAIEEVASEQFYPLPLITLSGTDISNGYVDIVEIATQPTLTRLETGGLRHTYGVDFTVSGSTLSWTGLGLDGILTAGDILQIELK